MVPLFGPVPGGMEILVIIIMAIMLFGLPLTIFGGLYLVYKRSQTEQASKDDVAKLENEVSELREEIRRRDAEGLGEDQEIVGQGETESKE
ncbi:hypothetical protein [Haladaptatus sp. NG-SE-30]